MADGLANLDEIKQAGLPVSSVIAKVPLLSRCVSTYT
jgi:hypothetical protein